MKYILLSHPALHAPPDIGAGGSGVTQLHRMAPAPAGHASAPGAATDRVLSEAQVAKMTGLSQRTLQRFRLEGGGPAFIRLSEVRIGYRHRDVTTWLEARTFASTSEETARRSMGGRN